MQRFHFPGPIFDPSDRSIPLKPQDWRHRRSKVESLGSATRRSWDGFLAAKDLGHPSEDVICRLLKESTQQRLLHHRYVRSRDHKGAHVEITELDHWLARARTHLFRSKRALALANYLRARDRPDSGVRPPSNRRQACNASVIRVRQRRYPENLEEE